MQTSDVVIVGSGVVGASTALELARLGRSVTVVDKCGAAGHGSTSASSAVVRFNYSTWDGVATAWESKARWEEWADHLGHRDPQGLARFVRCGFAFLDVDVVSWEAMAGLLEKAGIPYERWDDARLAEAVPGIDVGRYFPPKPVTAEEFADDAAGRLGAVFTPDAGYVDDPQLAAANLAHAAAANGARFLFNRTVIGVEQTGRVWQVRLHDGDVLETAVVVNAAGPWSTALNRLAGVGEDFLVEVAPMRQEVHHVPLPESLRGAPGGAPILGDLDLGTYLRPEADRNLLVGGTEPACDPMEWIDDPDGADPQPTTERFEAQVYRAARRLPDLAVPNRPRGVAGVYDVAADWTPVYDRTGADGFYVAMGTSGNQFKNAPIVGSVMATIVEEVESGHDHDRNPLTYTAPHTGHRIDLGSFSRRRPPNLASSGTVMG